METSVSSILANGRQKLGQRRLAQLMAEAETARKQALEREIYFEQLQAGLKALLPEELVEYVELPNDVDTGWKKLQVHVPGCAPVFIEMFIGTNGEPKLDGDKPYIVPGVSSILPHIDPEYGYFAGDVNFIYYPGKWENTDAKMGAEECGDLELALALAWERQAYYEQQRERIAEVAIGLEHARLELEKAQQARQVQEPVYEPLDGDLPEQLINKPELVRFVRGVVSEELEARGI